MPLLVLAVLVSLLFASPAAADDPIMPLDQVKRGMHCEGLSVFRGTAIESFDVEILDVIAPGPASSAAILFRASGPAVADTGLGPGFSGSPILCRDSEGTRRNAGAVAAGIGDYGNEVALATPIEAILGQPAPAPAQARPATAAERDTRPWTGPLTVSGLSPFVRRALWAAARRTGLDLLAAPAGASQVQTSTDLVPGSAVSAALSSGRIGLGSIGTVAYRRDSRVWAFGHPLDDAGTRELALEGAFVHAVIADPHPAHDEAGTYKLASPGTVAGTVDFDGHHSISGTLGAMPRTIPVHVSPRSGGERVPFGRTDVADESPLNYPAGFPHLALVSSIAATEGAFAALGSASGRSFGRLCMRVELRERRRPLGFCNRYVGSGRGVAGPQFAMGGDAAAAASLVEEYDRQQLRVDGVRISLSIDEGMRFAKIRRATAPRRARQGRRIRVRIVVQSPRERPRRLSFRMRIPRSVRPGMRTLRLRGTGPDGGEQSLAGIFEFALGGGAASHDELFHRAGAPAGVEQLAAAAGSIHRYDGIRASFRKRREEEAESVLAELFGFARPTPTGKPVYRHPKLRIGGRAKLRVRVLPRR